MQPNQCCYHCAKQIAVETDLLLINQFLDASANKRSNICAWLLAMHTITEKCTWYTGTCCQSLTNYGGHLWRLAS